ncbi:hypothetical protein GCM10023083_55030 [Streptomyces phyllanthi]
MAVRDREGPFRAAVQRLLGCGQDGLAAEEHGDLLTTWDGFRCAGGASVGGSGGTTHNVPGAARIPSVPDRLPPSQAVPALAACALAFLIRQ